MILATLLKVTFLHWCFSRFYNCRNGAKLRKILLITNWVQLFKVTLHYLKKGSERFLEDFIKLFVQSLLPNTEFFLARIFLHLNQKNSVFGHSSRSE